MQCRAVPLVSVAVLASIPFACGPRVGEGPLEPRAPWSDGLSHLFDDAVDFVSPLQPLLGTPWFDEYSNDVTRRVEEADIIAIVTVDSISLGSERAPVTVIEVVVAEPLLGPAGRGRALRLELDLHSAAHAQFDRQRQRILRDNRFVAYVRLYEDPDGEVRSHWHLSPDDPDLVDILRGLIEDL